MIVRPKPSEQPDVEIVLTWDEMTKLFAEMDDIGMRSGENPYPILGQIRMELYKVWHG